MKRTFLHVAFAVLLLDWVCQSAVYASGERSRRQPPGMGVTPSPRAPGNRPVVRTYVYSYHLAPYGYYPYPPLVVTPNGAYYQPPTIVVTHPYFCTLHQAGWVSRAGFLDHVAGTHKLPLESAAAFCPDATDGCLFPSY